MAVTVTVTVFSWSFLLSFAIGKAVIPAGAIGTVLAAEAGTEAGSCCAGKASTNFPATPTEVGAAAAGAGKSTFLVGSGAFSDCSDDNELGKEMIRGTSVELEAGAAKEDFVVGLGVVLGVGASLNVAELD